ncbi:MAG: GNAT family N-acetyltransferase [Dehalococcoidales bacterium]|nr:GNAT family N-acetyltransferase [Dehalococcoidales bacterium]
MIEIIKAEERHITAICDLWLEFMRYTGDSDPFFIVDEGSKAGFERDYLRPHMEPEKNLVLVAMDGDKMAGYLHGEVKDVPHYIHGQIGYVQHLFVTEAYRRRGIGEKLYNEIIQWFRSRDIKRVHLDALVKNKVANSFWRKHGYKDFQKTLYREI